MACAICSKPRSSAGNTPWTNNLQSIPHNLMTNSQYEDSRTNGVHHVYHLEICAPSTYYNSQPHFKLHHASSGLVHVNGPRLRKLGCALALLFVAFPFSSVSLHSGSSHWLNTFKLPCSTSIHLSIELRANQNHYEISLQIECLRCSIAPVA